jgi:molybdopterin-guanine dinucleotide biosynthesis protein A
MKEDKGLLRYESKTWSKLAVEKLIALDLAPSISINTSQIPTYKFYFSDDQLIVDHHSFADMGGPLVGVLSAHKAFPTEDLLVLACDFPKLHSIALQHLLDQFRITNSYEVVCFSIEGNIQPLCAIYSVGGLAKILLAYQNRELKKNSMMYVLAQLRTYYIDAKRDWIPYFKNFNAAADLDDLNN